MTFFEGKKTYLGILIAIVPVVAGIFGYEITPAEATEGAGIIEKALVNIEQIITIGGGLLAWYGRAVTKGNG